VSISEMHLSRAAVAGGNSTLHSLHHPFCHDAQGWGPLAAVGYDFTPCFVDVPLASVSVFGILAGAFTVRWLLNKASQQPTQKDWHYFAKLVSTLQTSL
jgi:ATP-binding cassette subfamily C (CFTR/MRP) protein 1